MQNKNIDLITSSSADILLNLVSIAKKHDLDVSKDTFLRTGNFSYITELSAKIIQNSVLSKQIDFNELFASTAINPLSLINLCRSFNIDVTTAAPAYGDLELTINLNEASNQQYTNIQEDQSLIEMYGQEITSLPTRSAIIIDRNTKFQVGAFNFYIEKSIAIWQDSITGRWVAKYLMTEVARTSFQNISSSSLNTKIRIINNITFLTIFPRAFQFEIQSLHKLIHKSEIIYTSVISFSYNDNYINSRLFYSLNNNRGGRKEIRLSNKLVSTSPFISAFGGQLSITFPTSLSSFRPSANSVLALETYVSKGSNGNLNFSKPLSIIQNEKSTHKYQMIVYIKGGITYGGSDEPTINQLRNIFINQVSSRNVISTESDLNLYFSKLKELVRTINKSDVLFIKKRDDILKRYFDAFILFRDNKNYSIDGGTDATSHNNDISNNYLSSIIPTYTFETVRFNESFSGSNIKYGQIIIPPNNIDDTAVFYSGANTSLINNNDHYIVPFYIHTTTTPINAVHYIFNRTNQTSKLTASGMGVTASNVWLFPTESAIRRTNFDQDHYEVKFYFETAEIINPNDYEYNVSLFQTGDSLLSSTLMVPTIDNVEYKDTSTGEMIIYTELTFRIEVDPINEFSFGESIALNLRIGTGTTISTKQVFSDIKFQLNIKRVGSTEAGIDVQTEYHSLFIDLQDIMHSDLKVAKQSTGNIIDYIDIYDVPCIHKSYLDANNNDMSFFISQMFTFVELLKESQKNIDQSEMINIKFFRTYGVSELYNTVKTNIDLRLDIMTKLTTVSEAKALVDAIRIFVDTYNMNKIFRYSDLVTDIMNSELGSYIYNIVFKGLNGTWEQSIEKINVSTVFYPEFFNIVGDALKSIKIYNFDPITQEKYLVLG